MKLEVLNNDFFYYLSFRIDIEAAISSGTSMAHGGHYELILMDYSKFSGYYYSVLKIQEANYDKVNLSYSIFKDTDLSGANFSDVNLSNSDWERANFSGVNFANANLNNVTISHSILIGANLSQEQLEQVKSIKCTVMPNGELNSNGC